MKSNRGGRPSLGADGENRTTVSIVGPRRERFNLSLLKKQVAFLESVGDGNRSKGFRVIIRLLSETARLFPLLEAAIQYYMDEDETDVHAAVDLTRWLENVDGVLEHGRADETAMGEPEAASA